MKEIGDALAISPAPVVSEGGSVTRLLMASH